MTRVLISTVYRYEPIIVTSNKFSAEHLILLVDAEPDDKMKSSLDTIKKSLGSALKIETVKTDIYDILKITQRVVDIIDSIPEKDDIFVDISTGRKTKSLGLFFAANARAKRIKKITYVTEEEKKVVSLPKMSYNLTEGQRKVIEYMLKNKVVSIMSLANELDISRGALYRHIKELKDLDMIEETSDGFDLTDYGKISVL